MKRFVNFFTCFIVITLFLGVSVSSIFASPSVRNTYPYSDAPPDGRTGSPADSGNTCVGCHTDFALNSGSLAFSITSSATYTAGTAQNVTVSFNNTNAGMEMFGFELSALDASNDSVGTFTAGTGTVLSTANDINYIKHTEEGHDHMGPDAGWDFQWTPPAGQTGTVTFYAAGNECDGTGGTDLDYIYTATATTSAVGAAVDPTPDIKINGSDGPLALGPSGTLSVVLGMNAGNTITDAVEWWLSINGQVWITLEGLSVTPQPLLVFQPLTFSNITIWGLPTPLPLLDDLVFTFSVDNNADGVQDNTYADSVSLDIRNVSFSKDIVTLFTGTGEWFPYGDPDIANGSPATSCAGCHGGNTSDPEECPPECHLIDFNTHAGWMAGADGGSEPLLGEAVAGTPPFNWGGSGLRKRLRNNRMPPGIPFNIDETNRMGGDVILAGAADANDIVIGAQFAISVEGAVAGYGEVEYTADHETGDHALGLLETYVAGLGGAPDTYAGSGGNVVFADIVGLFTLPNVWYNGGLSCTACHYCDTEPPCFHMIDFNTEVGLLAGADDGEEPLLGESTVGDTDYNWGESGLKRRLKNNRMPPNAAFDLQELTRDGRTFPHPLTGAPVTAVDLIAEWVGDGALDN